MPEEEPGVNEDTRAAQPPQKQAELRNAVLQLQATLASLCEGVAKLKARQSARRGPSAFEQGMGWHGGMGLPMSPFQACAPADASLHYSSDSNLADAIGTQVTERGSFPHALSSQWQAGHGCSPRPGRHRNSSKRGSHRHGMYHGGPRSPAAPHTHAHTLGAGPRPLSPHDSTDNRGRQSSDGGSGSSRSSSGGSGVGRPSCGQLLPARSAIAAGSDSSRLPTDPPLPTAAQDPGIAGAHTSCALQAPGTPHHDVTDDAGSGDASQTGAAQTEVAQSGTATLTHARSAPAPGTPLTLLHPSPSAPPPPLPPPSPTAAAAPAAATDTLAQRAANTANGSLGGDEGAKTANGHRPPPLSVHLGPSPAASLSDAAPPSPSLPNSSPQEGVSSQAAGGSKRVGFPDLAKASSSPLTSHKSDTSSSQVLGFSEDLALKGKEEQHDRRKQIVVAPSYTQTWWWRMLVFVKHLAWDVWHPHEPIRVAWDIIGAIAIMYAIIITPYAVAFEIDVKGINNPHAVVDLVINIIFMLDVLLAFRTAFISSQGHVICSRRAIAFHYLKFWFWIDAIASIPWDLTGDAEARLLELLRLTRTARVLRVVRLFKVLQTVKVFKVNQVFEMLENLFGRQRLSISFFAVVVAFAIHWASCLFFFLSSVNDFAEDTWVVRIGIEDESNVYKYITSAYWAITTMTTVGYGDIVAVRIEEKIVACVIMMAGTSMFAYMMGSVASLIASSSELEAKMTSRMLAIDRFVRAHRVPPALASKMRNFYTYRLERETQDEENEILAGLTDSLRSQLALFVYRDLLEKIPFFKDKSPSFITSIVPLLHPVYASPDDIITFQGEEGEEIFFVLEGRLEARLYAVSDADTSQHRVFDNPLAKLNDRAGLEVVATHSKEGTSPFARLSYAPFMKPSQPSISSKGGETVGLFQRSSYVRSLPQLERNRTAGANASMYAVDAPEPSIATKLSGSAARTGSLLGLPKSSLAAAHQRVSPTEPSHSARPVPTLSLLGADNPPPLACQLREGAGAAMMAKPAHPHNYSSSPYNSSNNTAVNRPSVVLGLPVAAVTAVAAGILNAPQALAIPPTYTHYPHSGRSHPLLSMHGRSSTQGSGSVRGARNAHALKASLLCPTGSAGSVQQQHHHHHQQQQQQQDDDSSTHSLGAPLPSVPLSPSGSLHPLSRCGSAVHSPPRFTKSPSWGHMATAHQRQQQQQHQRSLTTTQASIDAHSSHTPSHGGAVPLPLVAPAQQQRSLTTPHASIDACSTHTPAHSGTAPLPHAVHTPMLCRNALTQDCAAPDQQQLQQQPSLTAPHSSINDRASHSPSLSSTAPLPLLPSSRAPHPPLSRTCSATASFVAPQGHVCGGVHATPGSQSLLSGPVHGGLPGGVSGGEGADGARPTLVGSASAEAAAPGPLRAGLHSPCCLPHLQASHEGVTQGRGLSGVVGAECGAGRGVSSLDMSGPGALCGASLGQPKESQASHATNTQHRHGQSSAPKYTVLCSYQPGDSFGELACLKRRPQPATVVAMDLSYMYCLKRADLESVTELYPALGKELDKMVLMGQHKLLSRKRDP